MQERLPSPAMIARQEQISDFYTLVADKVKNGELKSYPQGYNFKVTIAEQTFHAVVEFFGNAPEPVLTVALYDTVHGFKKAPVKTLILGEMGTLRGVTSRLSHETQDATVEEVLLHTFDDATICAWLLPELTKEIQQI